MTVNTSELYDLLLAPAKGVSLSPTQWQNAILVLREAKLLAALYHSAIRQSCFEQYPDFAKRHLYSASVYAKRQSDQIRFEAMELRNLLGEIGVTVVFLKGAAYCLKGTLNSQGRICSDLDVLVKQSELEKAEQHLKSNRWVSEQLSDYDEKYYREWAHEVPPLFHVNRATVVDMHHNIYLPVSGRAPNIADFLSGKEKSESGCFVLDPASMLLHCIIHMMLNEDSSSWMRDLYDIYLLADELMDEKQWRNLLLLADKTQFKAELIYCLLALRHYCHYDFPSFVSDFIQAQNLLKKQRFFVRHIIISAIAPEHPLVSSTKTRLAKQLVYLRGHWLKMPLPVLLKHFLIKSFLGLRDKVVGKHHFDPKLPQNPNW